MLRFNDNRIQLRIQASTSDVLDGVERRGEGWQVLSVYRVVFICHVIKP